MKKKLYSFATPRSPPRPVPSQPNLLPLPLLLRYIKDAVAKCVGFSLKALWLPPAHIWASETTAANLGIRFAVMYATPFLKLFISPLASEGG